MSDHFENRLRAAMPLPGYSPNLDRKIDTAIEKRERQSRIVRRGLYLSTAVGVGIAAIVLMPTRADAVLQRIAGSLNDVEHLRMTRYTIQPDGSERKTGVTVYSRGRWRMEDEGHELEIYKSGVSYSYDPLLKVVRRFERPDGPFANNADGIGLESLLKSKAYMGPDTKVTVRDAELDGKPVIEATMVNRMEKLVIYADPETKMPISADGYSSSTGWKRALTMRFEYPKTVPASTFELDPGSKVIDSKEADRLVDGYLTSKLLTKLETKPKPFLLRSVDVAKDGTVFVTYQSGDLGRGFRGFRLSVSDDLGNEYANPTDNYALDAFRSGKGLQDGSIQQEIFVPLKPDAKWRPRKITLEGRFKGDKMIQFVAGFSKYEDGTWEYRLFPNTPGIDPEEKLVRKELWSSNFQSPTCEWAPESARLIDRSHFGNDWQAQIFRMEQLSNRSLNFGQFSDAAPLLQSLIDLKERATAEGFGPFGTDENRRILRDIRSGSLTRPPQLR